MFTFLSIIDSDFFVKVYFVTTLLEHLSEIFRKTSEYTRRFSKDLTASSRGLNQNKTPKMHGEYLKTSRGKPEKSPDSARES